METQLPSGVPSCQSRKWSQIAPATDSAGVRFLACRQSRIKLPQILLPCPAMQAPSAPRAK